MQFQVNGTEVFFFIMSLLLFKFLGFVFSLSFTYQFEIYIYIVSLLIDMALHLSVHDISNESLT